MVVDSSPMAARRLFVNRAKEAIILSAVEFSACIQEDREMFTFSSIRATMPTKWRDGFKVGFSATAGLLLMDIAPR